MTNLDIPDFLKISAADRKASWVGRKLTDSHGGGDMDARLQRDRDMRAAIEAERKEKSLAALAALKASHAGETYDRKLKMWVPCAA